MKKTKNTKSQPRFVVYASEDEVSQATNRAKSVGVRGHNKWAGVVIRKELSKPSK